MRQSIYAREFVKSADNLRNFFLKNYAIISQFQTGKQISQSYGYMNLWLAFNVGSPYVTDVCSLGLPYYLLLVKVGITEFAVVLTLHSDCTTSVYH